ncbi:roundabout homolog 3-like [Xenia sp. Carnegie-2017]|uniref:roundabout homolog 3-like n=1 Tax=Xenia sp. Carnegie-2017 TaxID=2897299 RepID=UPI001F0439A4|nr:roundabout homolog 3-like [Xenia sp. Carnegie-2017]
MNKLCKEDNIRKDFREEPQSQVVALGGRLVLSCRSPRSKPKPKIGWLKNNQELFNVNGRVSFKNNKQILTIKNVKKEDEGNYQCEAVNVAGRRLSKIAVVRTTVPPTILSISKEKTINIRLQSQTTLTCVASGIPKPKIIWKKLGNSTILPSFNGTLKLTKLKSNDAGSYQCIAFNKVRNVSANVQLILQYVPEFKFISSNVNAVEGSNFTLKCLARSEPYPTVLWYKGKTEFVPDIIYDNKQAKLVNGSIQLSFKPLSLSDAGNYSCRASNKIGSNSRLVSVYVHRKSEFPAFIKTPNRHVIADINEDVNIVCDVRGNPKPAVKWEKDGKYDFINDADVMLREEMLSKIYRHILTITKVRKRNGGIFRCVASNTISTVSKYMTLQVTRKLHLRESVKIGSPRKPNNVTVVEFNDNSARITWKESKDPVMVYAVGYVNIDIKNDEVIVADNISPNTQEYVVTNLLPKTRYMFFVRGFNGKGYGEPSLLSYEIKTLSSLPTNPIEEIPEEIPLPILKINVTSGIAGQLYVRWAPIKENVKIDGFYIYWQAESLPFQNETLQNVRSSGYMISDLQNSTKYSVYVKVFNKAGEGPVSETIEQWTSSEPVTLQMGIMQNDTDSIKVTWKRLWKKMSGNDTLKTYIIFYSSTSDKGNDRHKRNVVGVITIPAFPEHYYHVIGDLHPGENITCL